LIPPHKWLTISDHRLTLADVKRPEERRSRVDVSGMPHYNEFVRTQPFEGSALVADPRTV